MFKFENNPTKNKIVVSKFGNTSFFDAANKYLDLTNSDFSDKGLQKRCMVLYHMADTYIRYMRNIEKGIKFLYKALKEYPCHRDILVYLAELYISIGNYEPAYLSAINALNIKNRADFINTNDLYWNDSYINQIIQQCYYKINTID